MPSLFSTMITVGLPGTGILEHASEGPRQHSLGAIVAGLVTILVYHENCYLYGGSPSFFELFQITPSHDDFQDDS